MTATILSFPKMAQLPNRIRELRKARGWTLEQLAERIGCGTTYMSDLERGERELSFHWMKRIARAFKVEVADLLNSTDNSRALDADEHELLGLFQKADQAQRQQMLGMARLLVGPLSTRKVA